MGVWRIAQFYARLPQKFRRIEDQRDYSYRKWRILRFWEFYFFMDRWIPNDKRVKRHEWNLRPWSQ